MKIFIIFLNLFLASLTIWISPKDRTISFKILSGTSRPFWQVQTSLSFRRFIWKREPNRRRRLESGNAERRWPWRVIVVRSIMITSLTYSVADARHFKASQTWWLGFHLDSYRVFFGVRQGQSPTQYLVLLWLLKWLFWVRFVLFYVLASNIIGWTWVERIPCTLHVPFNKKIYFCKSYLS